jgi:glycosyltransferase involved in cell wall biosynthesis
MRVCIVYDCLYPYTVGGGERWFGSLAERLAREGHEVTYLTLRQWDRGTTPDAGPGVRVVTAGPRLALYGQDGRRRILPPLVFGLGVLAHLLRHGRRYDVVNTSSFPYFSQLAAALLRRVMGYELVVDWFEVWSAAYWREYLGPFGGRVGAFVQRLCARVAQRAHCFSELHAQRLQAEGLRGPVTVLRGLHAGELRVLAARAAGSPPTVLFAGRLIPEKRVTLAVAAIAQAAERVPDLRGVIAGDGPDRDALIGSIAEHGLEDRVRVLGFAAAEQLEREMRGATCLLLTSSREGYGLVVVEAAGLGTPSVVVAGEDNAAVELIEEGRNGTVAPAAEPAAVAAAIVRVHEAGMRMRRDTVAWVQGHAHELTLEASLEKVLASYASARS